MHLLDQYQVSEATAQEQDLPLDTLRLSDHHTFYAHEAVVGVDAGTGPLAGCRATRAAAESEQTGVVLMSVTCVADGLDHRVSDVALGAAGRSGRYRALCGRLVLPAPLVAAPGPVCQVCAMVLAKSHQRSAHSGGWARLIQWLGGLRWRVPDKKGPRRG